MKNIYLSLLLIFSISLLSAQEDSKVDLLKTESTWTKEIFHFPLGFAPEIKYEGVEEAQFLPGWPKQESPEFWSYVFAWKIQIEREISAEELEQNIELYFDGLMRAVNKDTSLTVPPTTALFLPKEKNTFIGKVRLYDSFKTLKVFTLQAKVESHYCKEKKQAILLFKFSPQAFGHAVWAKLKLAQLRASVCDL